MHDEVERRQIEAAGSDVGADADAGAAVAEGLQRAVALVLAEFPGEGDGVETALEQAALEAADGLAGGAEHQRGATFEVTQHVDGGALDVVRGDRDGAVFDVAMWLVAAADVEAKAVALIATGEGGDLFRDGRRKQESAALGGRGVEEEFELVAKAHVEHLVGFVEHGNADLAQVEAAPLRMILQATRRAHDDVRAGTERTGFGARIHAAHGRRDAGAGLAVEPSQLGLDLDREFTRRRDHQSHRRRRLAEALGALEQRGRECQTERDGLAGPGLGGDQQVAPLGLGHEHGALDGGGFRVVAGGERLGEGGVDIGKWHGAGNYFPWKRGWRFSMKAVRPSV